MKGERLRAALAALATLRSPCLQTILTVACLRLAPAHGASQSLELWTSPTIRGPRESTWFRDTFCVVSLEGLRG